MFTSNCQRVDIFNLKCKQNSGKLRNSVTHAQFSHRLKALLNYQLSVFSIMFYLSVKQHLFKDNFVFHEISIHISQHFLSSWTRTILSGIWDTKRLNASITSLEINTIFDMGKSQFDLRLTCWSFYNSGNFHKYMRFRKHSEREFS